MNKFDLIVIGGGPAGYTAGIYGVRAGLSTAVFTGIPNPSLLSYSGGVENFPGFEESTPGGIVVSKIRNQAKRLGAELIDKSVTSVRFDEKSRQFTVGVGEDSAASPDLIGTDAVIVATGTQPKKLEVPGEEAFFGRGVAVCATCDAAFYKDKTVAVIGGGDAAAAEALHLSHFASTVFLVHRREELRACQRSQDQMARVKNIKLKLSQNVKEIVGSQKVEKLILEHAETKETSELPVDGVFVSIGTIPSSELITAYVDQDEVGYPKTSDGVSTKTPGLFVAGDLAVADPGLHQAIIAAASGARAALMASRYLQEK